MLFVYQIYMFFFCRFILENFVIEKHMRCVLTVYPVVIWALLGNLAKNFDDTSPNRNGLFIGKTKHSSNEKCLLSMFVCPFSRQPFIPSTSHWSTDWSTD